MTLVRFLPLLSRRRLGARRFAALHEFGRELGVRVGAREYAGLVLGTMPYQWLVAYAAVVRAAVRERRGETGWEKTAHVGDHRGGARAVCASCATTPRRAPELVAARPPSIPVPPRREPPMSDPTRSVPLHESEAVARRSWYDGCPATDDDDPSTPRHVGTGLP